MKKENKTEELVTRLKRGDREAFDTIYSIFSLHVYNFVLSILFTKSLAADLTQDVFAKIWEKRRDLKPDLDFEAYIFTIARNLVYKESRRMLTNSAFVSYSMQSAEPCEETTARETEWKSSSALIDGIIDKMPPVRRRIYIMNKVEMLPAGEIAERLSLSKKTVENQLYRANLFMRRHFPMNDDSKKKGDE